MLRWAFQLELPIGSKGKSTAIPRVEGNSHVARQEGGPRERNPFRGIAAGIRIGQGRARDGAQGSDASSVPGGLPWGRGPDKHFGPDDMT